MKFMKCVYIIFTHVLINDAADAIINKILHQQFL